MATHILPTTPQRPNWFRVITTCVIALTTLAGCGDPTAQTRQTLDMHIANYQRLKAEADQDEYANEVKRYGQKAVVECRARGLPHDAYWYCLTSLRPDVTPAVPLNSMSAGR